VISVDNDHAMTSMQVHRAIIVQLQLQPTDKVKRYGGISVAALVWGGVWRSWPRRRWRRRWRWSS
jgi:hypothetical protein